MANTGRTSSKWVDFRIGDTANTLRSLPINSINGVGVVYPTIDMSAFQDAIKGVLPETPECTITITGPFDNSAAATAGALSGAHTVLVPMLGDPTPRSLDVQIGIREAWSSEPQFGITRTATSGFWLSKYEVDISSMLYTAEFVMYPGSSAPAWGTSAEAGS